MAQIKRKDKQITKEIHHLFLRATLQDKPGLIVCLATRIPALVLYNILIPLQIAYGLQAIFDKRFDAIYGHVLIILLLALGYSILWAIGGWTISRNGRIGSEYIQREVFKNYLQKDYEFFGNTHVGALGTQATQIRTSYSEYSQVFLLYLPFILINIVVALGVIAWNSLPLAGITLVTMASVLSFTLWFSRKRLDYRRRLSEASGAVGGAVSDALSHGTTVKSFASEGYEAKYLQKSLRAWGEAQQKTWASSIPADVGRMILAAIAIAAVLAMTAHLYQKGAITIAIVTLVQLYVIRMISETQEAASLIKLYESAMGSAYQSVKTMLVPTTVNDPERAKKIPKGRAYEIDLQGISYHYSKALARRPAVDNIDLHIRPGEKIGLIGYSGSGKTTLSKLLLRFMDVSDGSLAINGVDIREVRQRDLRKLIAYVPQEPLLFHRSIRENIAYGRPGASEKDVIKAARAAYVQEFVNDLPEGYDTVVGERGVKLSGGQRQRVAIARALLKDAPLLVMDEATSALDSESERLIQDALWKLMDDRTAVVIAHRLSTIRRLDRIVVMDKGRIIQVGTHHELLKDEDGIYAKLWAHQSDGYIGAAVS